MKAAATMRLMENDKTDINLQIKLCWPHRGKWDMFVWNNFLIFSGFQTGCDVVDEWKSALALRIIIFGQIYLSGKLNPKQFWLVRTHEEQSKKGNICKICLIGFSHHTWKLGKNSTWVSWIELHHSLPVKNSAEVLTSGTSECDLLWK